ncbi:uncharacterized protein LAJ45_01570 [Morchella importuna]|uniref:uncharacterized protein n=1 Tax=Morchella importuna TaxID=1174673 RepID=UPI001E8D7CE5|nr:uncharacterized protein LAJ45_01570 [Morchella importuna]KAH8153803.1 hypothetical protein LAJ45_01570 [Morchella importuna]
MNDASTGESSKHKRAHGDEGEPEPGESGSTDASGQSGNDDVSEFSLTKGKPNTRAKGKRQKVAATVAATAAATATATASVEEPTTPGTKSKRAPSIKKITSPERSFPATGVKKGATPFMTRKEAEMVFDMAIESANWGLITEKLNSSKSRSSVSSSRNLKRHVLTVLKKQALSRYN